MTKNIQNFTQEVGVVGSAELENCSVNYISYQEA